MAKVGRVTRYYLAAALALLVKVFTQRVRKVSYSPKTGQVPKVDF